ncbi:MAG: hypothetical protein IJF65_06385 [Clostridia bacterium]|nr:hypothetical protein [Clostridia bacterium]
MMQKITAVLMCLLLLISGSALSEEAFSPHWAELEEQMADGHAMHLDLSAQLLEWSPFESEITGAINTLLSHFGFGVDYFQRGDEIQHTTTVTADNEAVVSMTQRDTAEGIQWYTDLYDAVYTLEAGSGARPLSWMAQPEEGDLVIWEDLLLGEIDLNGLLEHMTQVLTQEGKAAKSTKNLSKIGRAAKTYKITTDGEGARRIVLEAAQALNHPAASAFVEQLTFSGKKNIFTLYEKKDGVILGLNFTGNAAYGDGDTRKVSLTWGVKAEGQTRLDTFNLTAPSSKGSNKLTVKLTWNRAWKDAANTQTLTGTIASTLNKVKFNQSIDMELKNAKALNGHQITGTLQVDTTQNDVKETLILQPKIQTAKDDQGISFRGTMGVRNLKNKKTMLDAVLSLSMDPGEEPVLESDSLMELIPLEELSEEALAETEEDLAQMLAHRMLMALMNLPQEDIKVLQTGISDDNWALIMETFQDIAP